MKAMKILRASHQTKALKISVTNVLRLYLQTGNLNETDTFLSKSSIRLSDELSLEWEVSFNRDKECAHGETAKPTLHFWLTFTQFMRNLHNICQFLNFIGEEIYQKYRLQIIVVLSEFVILNQM